MSGARQIEIGTDDAKFRFFVLGINKPGSPPALGGATGLVEGDFELYAATPGASLPGSAISAANYVITERGFGDYDLAFSVDDYFDALGVSSIIITRVDGDFAGEVVARLYYEIVPYDVKRIVGLAHNNSLDDERVYNTDGTLASFRKRTFASSTILDAADEEAADDIDGEIARYQVEFTYTAGKLTSWRWSQEL